MTNKICISGLLRYRELEGRDKEVNEMGITLYEYEKPGALHPGRVERDYFRRLVEVCALCNPKVIKALEQVLVHGKTRKEACACYGVALSYFSVKVRQLQSVSILIQEMYPCSRGQGTCPLHVRQKTVNDDCPSDGNC